LECAYHLITVDGRLHISLVCLLLQRIASYAVVRRCHSSNKRTRSFRKPCSRCCICWTQYLYWLPYKPP